MKHHFLDQYSDRASPLHSLDPRVKILTFLSFVVVVVLTPLTPPSRFLFYALLLFSLVLLSRVHPGFLLKRSAVVLPFVGLVAVGLPFLGGSGGSYNLGPFHVTHSALLIFANVLLKSWFSVMVMGLLVSTTPFTRLLRGFQSLGLPALFTTILSFMYRYLYLLTDEFERMTRARDSRAWRMGRLERMRVTGNMVGAAFLRSYERGERVYLAMRARGFDGGIRVMREPRMGGPDFLFLSLFFPLLLLPAVMV
ncbi:MAG: cobalt ECF transporter T component CbiQ [Candidatus Hadarchaeales archaeon]